MSRPPVLAFRAAYDLGSGATKIGIGYKLLRPSSGHGSNVSKNHHTSQKPHDDWQMLYQMERVAMVGIAVRASADTNIPDSMYQLLRSVLSEFRTEELKAVKQAHIMHGLPLDSTPFTFQRFGVATATYREAVNGPKVLAALQEEFQLPISTISQKAEGQLGFLAAAILLRKKQSLPKRMVAWDSGGASFQLTLGDPTTGEVYNTWGKHWGTSRAASTLIRDVQHREFREGLTANPVTEQQFAQLVQLVQADCETDMPQWLRDYCQQPDAVVVTIGGPSNAFTACSKIRKQAVVSQQDVERIFADNVANRDDAAVALLNVVQPDFLAGKLGIVLGVMRSTGIRSFRHFYSSGNTRSLIATDAYWKADSHAASKL